ncbi:MAG: alpha/beta hydrolase [Candidatus Parcubacteria bacterium]|nr:alpha/beta hydrolase [Candidatus Parcubacteria bacterium]
MKNAIILQGAGETTESFWLPYVKKELENLGIKALNQEFPDPEIAGEKYWVPFIKELGADENTILIGHSSGAVAAMRFAEKNRILGSILVGACYTDLGDEREKKSGYFNRPWDWESIRKNQQWIVQFASTDDPYIPIEEARHINKVLQTEYHEYTDEGHFGGDKEKIIFPEIVEIVKSKIGVLPNR